MRTLPFLISVLSAISFLTSCNDTATQSPVSTRPPNIVLIFADDMAYADINPFSELNLQTPNLDRMAAEGAVFTQFYVAQPICSASRAALLTGSYSNRVGVQGALFPGNTGLALAEITLAEVLKKQGYATAHFGKWHLGDAPQFLPTNQGFDTFFGIPYSNDMRPQHPLQSRFNFGDLMLYENTKPSEPLYDQSELTQRLTAKSAEFIRANRDNPFFLYLAHPQPHVPLYASEQFRGSTGKGLYADVIAELDWSVGKVLDTLKEEGVDENTLVIFTSDNGPWMVYGNHAGSAGQLREGKSTVFEGGVREPFVIRWPGQIPAGYKSDTPFMSIDLFPTLARLAGAELPARKIDGVDAWAVLSGQSKTSPQPAYFFYFGDNELQGVRYQNWKLYFPHSYRSLNGRAGGQNGEMGAMDTLMLTEIELYDLDADPSELQNVASENPEVVIEINEIADTMRADLGDSLQGIEGAGRRPLGVVE